MCSHHTTACSSTACRCDGGRSCINTWSAADAVGASVLLWERTASRTNHRSSFCRVPEYGTEPSRNFCKPRGVSPTSRATWLTEVASARIAAVWRRTSRGIALLRADMIRPLQQAYRRPDTPDTFRSSTLKSLGYSLRLGKRCSHKQSRVPRSAPCNPAPRKQRTRSTPCCDRLQPEHGVQQPGTTCLSPNPQGVLAPLPLINHAPTIPVHQTRRPGAFPR